MQSKNPIPTEKKENNVLDKLGKKTKPSIISVTAPKEDEEKEEEFKNDGPQKKIVRKGVVKVTDLNDNISKVEDLTIKEENNYGGSLDNNYEGYLYKLTKTKKLKKMYFRLIDKDMYCKYNLNNILDFKTKDETEHKGMHNLSGVYFKEEKPDVLEGISLFSFSINYPKKNRIYYVESEVEFKIWLEKLRVTTGYSELNDLYEIKEVIGKGKFGLVRLGVHKESKRLVAVKIMNKKQMSNQDQELVKTEIEILKICQQPNIIQLYDIFENTEEIKISKYLY
jgi:hypothetical protein